MTRVFAPVGVAVNVTGKIVKNVFKAAKRVGSHAVTGANKVINSVKTSVKNRRLGKKNTRRRKN